MKGTLKKWLTILLTLTLIFTFAACGNAGDAENAESDPVEVPEEVQAIMDKTTELAANYALQLDGEWADLYAECLESGEGRDFAGYADLKATLDQMRLECGAYYVYILTDMDENDDYFDRMTGWFNMKPKDSFWWHRTENRVRHCLHGITTLMIRSGLLLLLCTTATAIW